MPKSLLVVAMILTLALIGCGDSGSPSGNDGHEGHEGTDAGTPASTDYPLTTCVVSGEELGSMGDPIIIQHEGQEVRFCCQSCVATFEKDPARYLAKLKQE